MTIFNHNKGRFRHLLKAGKFNVLPGAVFVAACASTVSIDEISFSHNLHSEQGLDCSDCHANVDEDAEKKLTPMSMAQCGDCHDVEDKAQCKTCHTNAEASKGWPATTSSPLLFSHQTHRKRQPDAMKDCAACHGAAATATTNASRKALMPQHAECNACHKKDLTMGRCELCHDRLDLYDMAQNDFYSHEPGFMGSHGKEAISAEARCALCHEQSYCADCHNKNATVRPSLRFPDKTDRAFMHSGDWMSRHALVSRTDPASCQKCHGVSYCTSCHNRMGVGAGVDQGGGNYPDSHKDRIRWLGPGPQSHGSKARRDILSCASCHDKGAASNCVSCHQESMGINPHPPGWQSPVPASERHSHPMCRICHH
ncbi:MAG: cytochrome c3 family protein [Deltaproteobacteria bacterium]|nr:cytochrome c3 family protein [Deltaproteobacteria bacterium]